MTTKSLEVRVGADTREMERKLSSAQKRIQAFRASINKIGRRMAMAGAVVAGAAVLMIKNFAAVGDEVHKMALRTGFATETLSELRYAAQISGADINALEKGVKRMAKTINDSTKAGGAMATYIRAFDQIGLEAEELIKLSPEEQFDKIGRAIAAIESPTIRAARAQDIFGRAGTQLLPLFAAGEEGLEALKKKAHELGIVFDQEAANKAAEFTDQMTTLKGAFQGVGFSIAKEFMPYLTSLADHFTEVFINIRGNTGTFVRSILGFFQVLAKGIMGLGLAWHGLQTLIFEGASLLTEHLRDMVAKLVMMFAVMEKLPIVGVKFKGVTDFLWDSFKLLDIITDGYKETAEEHIDTMANMIEKYEALKKALDGVADGFDKMKKKAVESAEVLVETVIPAAHDTAGIVEAAGKTHEGVVNIWGKKSDELSKGETAAMHVMMTAYGGSIKSIIDFFEKWAAAALIKWVMTTLPFPANLIAAPIAMIAMKGLFSAIKGFEKGGFVPQRTLAELHPGEFVLNAPTVRALAGPVRRAEPAQLPARYQFDITTIIGEEQFYSQVVRNVNRAGELGDLKIPVAVIAR